MFELWNSKLCLLWLSLSKLLCEVVVGNGWQNQSSKTTFEVRKYRPFSSNRKIAKLPNFFVMQGFESILEMEKEKSDNFFFVLVNFSITRYINVKWWIIFKDIAGIKLAAFFPFFPILFVTCIEWKSDSISILNSKTIYKHGPNNIEDDEHKNKILREHMSKPDFVKPVW